MVEATVCHILRGSGEGREILLGKRKTLFCNGIWNGPGGKLRRNEKPLTCLKREIREEIGVHLQKEKVVHVATIDFYHPRRSVREHRLEWRVYYFNTTFWQGEPELHPRIFDEIAWFEINRLPYDQMLPDRKLWMPMVFDENYRDRLLFADVFYGDSEMRGVEKWDYRFVPKTVQMATLATQTA